MTTIISVENVSFGYGPLPVIEDVSLTVDAGEFLGLVGPNGSGKSTLLKLMLGLLEPDSGRVMLFGESAVEFSHGERIGYVAQDVTSAAKEMPITVREVVTMGRYPRIGFGRLDARDREIVAKAMETVDIAHLATRRITHLSGGQRQRVFIARALAAEADLLALDEPAVGVDAESREAFYDLLKRLNGDGMTIMLIDHDIGVVTEHATNIACINRRLFFHGGSAGFTASDALAEAYGANQRVLHHDHTHSAERDHSHDDHDGSGDQS